MSESSLLPTRLPPSPRRVRGILDGGIIVLRIFGVLSICAVPFCLAYLAVVFLWASQGTNTAGQITETYHTKNKSSYTYHVKYTYSTPRGPQQDRGHLDQTEYTRIQLLGENDSRDIPIRYLDLGFLCYSGLAGNVAEKQLSAIGFLCLAGAFSAIFFYLAWVKPAREKALVRDGIALPGAITGKGRVPGKHGGHYVDYFFEDSVGQRCQAKMTVYDFQRWGQVKIGQVVTVLVHPNNSRRSVVYELSRCQVDNS